MQIVNTVLVAIQMLSALIMIGLILVQHGKGADMGAAFGSGNSGSLLGVSGSANFMSRATAVLAAVFFVCTLALAYFSGVRPTGVNSVLEKGAITAPAGAASGAATGSAPIPTGASQPAVLPAAPASGTSAAPAMPATPTLPAAATPAAAPAASGAAPIPSK
jgi:preprotein translocase subunit SecG